MNVLGICLDYLMLQKDNVRGDVRQRQFDYATQVKSLTLVVYSPRGLNFKPQQWSDNLWIYPTNSKNKICFIVDALKIARKICKEIKIDVITAEDPFTTGLVGFLLKKWHKIPLNIQTHVDFCDNFYWLRQRKINWLFNKLGKFTLRRADTVRVGTYYEENKLSKELKKDEKTIHVIPVNSDLNKFIDVNGDVIRKQYCNVSFDKILLFTGRLVPQKDIPTLLRAFSLVLKERPRTLLLIVGSGRECDNLKKLSMQLGINKNVMFTGSIEHEKIPQYLAACDIYTISSIFEGTCIAMAEAMASKRPVVATKFAGSQDLIVNGDTGFVVELKDYKALAYKVLYLLNNSEVAKEMGEKAAKKAEDIFSNNQNIDKVIKMWEQTVKC